MSPYTLDELITRWNRGQLAEVQAITHVMLHLVAQEQRIAALEQRLLLASDDRKRMGEEERQ